MPVFRPISFLLGASFLLLSSNLLSLRVGAPEPTSRLPRRQSTVDVACGFEGSSDIYGLGIRLGVCFQWVSAIISKKFLASSNLEIMHDLVTVNTIFSLAIFIATALLTIGGFGTAHGVEILILLHIYFGSVYIVMYD